MQRKISYLIGILRSNFIISKSLRMDHTTTHCRNQTALYATDSFVPPCLGYGVERIFVNFFTTAFGKLSLQLHSRFGNFGRV